MTYSNPLTRRDFIKGAGGGLVAALLPACSTDPHEKVLRREQEVLTAYRAVIDKVSPKVKEALNVYMRSNGYTSLAQISADDYIAIVKAGLQKESKDPNVTLLLNLNKEDDIPSLGHNLNKLENLDLSRLKRREQKDESQLVYIIERQLPTFADPELIVPDPMPLIFLRIADVSGRRGIDKIYDEAKVYSPKNGITSVQIAGVYDYVSKGGVTNVERTRLWAPSEYLKPEAGYIVTEDKAMEKGLIDEKKKKLLDRLRVLESMQRNG